MNPTANTMKNRSHRMSSMSEMNRASASPAEPVEAPAMLNGVSPGAITELIGAVADDPAKGMTSWSVRTLWEGGNRTMSRVDHYKIGGRTVAKDWTIRTDEPLEIGGTNTQPNPQEYLLAAVNACMMVTYVDYAAVQGIRIDEIEIETEGDIDLRGLFQLGEDVNPGYDRLDYRVRIKADASREQLEALHETVRRTSPNFANMARAVAMNSTLVID
ncbi:MAG: OsmC family protein [Phycisphaerales bacterium JB037]